MNFLIARKRNLRELNVYYRINSLRLMPYVEVEFIVKWREASNQQVKQSAVNRPMKPLENYFPCISRPSIAKLIWSRRLYHRLCNYNTTKGCLICGYTSKILNRGKHLTVMVVYAHCNISRPTYAFLEKMKLLRHSHNIKFILFNVVRFSSNMAVALLLELQMQWPYSHLYTY